MILKNIKKDFNYYKNIKININEAINIIKINSSKKFIENLEISINTKKLKNKSVNDIIGYFLLPNNTGKKMSVGVFSEEKNIEKIKKMGADFVGIKNIIEILNNKKFKIDVLLSDEKTINIINKFFLKDIKNKNLIPSKKLGTIVSDLSYSINSFKNGNYIFYKSDKNGVINTFLSKINVCNNFLEENINNFIKYIELNKPKGIKDNFIKSAYISSTMGIGIKIL